MMVLNVKCFAKNTTLSGVEFLSTVTCRMCPILHHVLKLFCDSSRRMTTRAHLNCSMSINTGEINHIHSG